MGVFRAILLTASLVASSAAAAELRLDEEHIYLRADRERLKSILEAFVHAGVTVQVEPGIDAIVSGTLEDVSITEGLDQLLGQFNYVLFWRQINGPLDPITKLNGIHLFRPGRREAVVPFVPTSSNLAVVQMRGIPAHVKDEILVGLKTGTTSKQFRTLLAAVGATVVDSLAGFGIYQVRLPRDSNVPALVKTLQQNPWVAVVEPNYVQEIADPTPTQGPHGETGVSPAALPRSRIPGAPAADSAAVAIFDSGLSDPELLGDSVVGTYDAIKPGRSMADPVGHGTQMALVASGAVVPNGVPDTLADDDVPVVAIRSFDDNGRTSTYSILRGIEYAMSQNARVLSMSWGSETDSEFLATAIAYAQDQDIIVVAAAGNEPTNQPVYPAAYNEVLAIAALQADGTIWPESNYGSFIFAAAPGTGEFPVGHNGPPGSYIGTSIASPTVARALTLYFAEHPGATSSQAVDALRDALTDIGDPGQDEHAGHGALDAAALERFLATP